MPLTNLINRCLRNNSNTCPISNLPCYNPNAPSLIFRQTIAPQSGYWKQNNKIIFISDAPYNFPGYPQNHRNLYAQTFPEFIKLHFQQFGLENAAKKYGTNLTPQQAAQMPRNIFDFIYLTFHPIFTSGNQRNWASDFLQRVYWTHFCKRTYKTTEKIPLSCVELLKREIEIIDPWLIISVLKKDSVKTLFGCSFDDLEKYYQAKGGGVFTLHVLCKDRQIALFPNPSGANRMKKEFYGQNYVPNLIAQIHSII